MILLNFKQHLALAILIVATTIRTSSDSRADLIIAIPHVTVAPGASGFLDVLVSSDGTDSFQKYSLDFLVGGAPHAAAPINFVESSPFPVVTPAPQLSATGPDYIFRGNSLEEDPVLGLFGIDFVNDPPGGPTADDLIVVADETFDLLDRTIILADGNFLLARLNFVAPLSATPGNVYDVSLDELNSVFADIDFAPTSIFSSNVGSITISAAAVPEPSSFAVLGCGVGCLLIHRRKKRRSAHNLTE